MSRESYETHPYPTAPHFDSHPSTLQTVATIFGLFPPAIETARVLELGCATGGNIVPMACALPNARFVGIDYSPRQIEQARAYAAGVDASNLTLETKSILDITSDFGQFDYIIAHGIYSWVPEDVRKKVLSICRENLSDTGVAFISFNCQPGWHVLQWIREFVLRTSPTNSVADIKRAIDRVLVSPKLKQMPIGPALQKIADAYQSADETQWLHDLLEDNNQPFYFGDFVAELERHHLAYVGDALSNGSHVEEQDLTMKTLLAAANGDWIKREQTLDFIRNTMFRRAVVVRDENAPRRQTSPERFDELWLTCAMRADSPTASMSDASVVNFRERRGAGIASSSPLSKTAIAALGNIFPKAVKMSELLRQSAATLQLSGEQFESMRPRTARELFLSWMLGIVQASVTPAAVANEISERPEVWKVTRYQASIGQSLLTNLRHEVIKLDVGDRLMIAILQLLDGTRTQDEVVAALATQLSQPIASLRPHAMQSLDTILKNAVRYGVLVR